MTEFQNFGYKTDLPCDVCGKEGNNQSEPRFGYVVCENHYKLSPVEVSEAKLTLGHTHDNKIKEGKIIDNIHSYVKRGKL